MKYVPFDPSLIGKQRLIIWCPNPDDSFALVKTLVEEKVNLTGVHFSVYGDDSCYRVERNRSAGYASKGFYEGHTSYSDYLFAVYEGPADMQIDVEDLI